MAEKQSRIVEIDGIKMEVDLRHAKRVDTFRVGDRVKLLRKEYSNHYVNHGVIVGFENFQSLPTIVVAYVENEYRSAEIKLAYINANTNPENSKKYEMVPDTDESLVFSKAEVVGNFDRQVEVKLEEIRDIYRKKRYFLRHFGVMFGDSPEVLRHQDLEQLKAQVAVGEQVSEMAKEFIA